MNIEVAFYVFSIKLVLSIQITNSKVHTSPIQQKNSLDCRNNYIDKVSNELCIVPSAQNQCENRNRNTTHCPDVLMDKLPAHR